MHCPRAQNQLVHRRLIRLGLGLLLVLGGCAKKNSDSLLQPPPADGNPLFSTLSFGTLSNLEVITWNVRNFPQTTQTVRYLVSAIRAIDADIVCIQEIENRSAFLAVIDSLDQYEGFAAASDNYINLGILYKSSTVSDVSFEELFTSLWQPFPRAPLQMTATFGGSQYVVINNHLKCCGDGQIALNDDGDEESRRAEASRLLESHIATNLPDSKVILVGDLNDRLTDPPPNNVFQVFFDRPAEYRFADFELASGPSSEFSWIGSNTPSHIDHILVTNELFGAINDGGALVLTLKPEVDLVGGINEFREVLSDHRPVAMRIAP
jgi:endonuclease/exonuclease/phosphatase family metal-dependent hydrolase